MHSPYEPREIEPKWQSRWESAGLFHAKTGSDKKKFYPLVEFPYPSGEGLHTGHVRGYTAMDIVARKRRMEGFEVLYPIGWDAFGLPTENHAIKTGIHPADVTKKNTDNFRRQMKSLGFSFDWSREINTTDPEYYTWTQWIFLQLFKKGLAYKAKMNINWCPSCKIGLANEEAAGGVCERCGALTEKREKEQWMLAITKYADRLDRDLDHTDYWDKIKIQQRNWIGRSEGARVQFSLISSGSPLEACIEVFTTRVDTIFGCMYVVVAPEHSIFERDVREIRNREEIDLYRAAAKKRREQDRADRTSEKTGIRLEGIEAVNPFTGESVPIFVADYVLGSYGTGAVMAVPAHDERDHAFAKRHDLPIRRVVEPKFVAEKDEEAALHGGQALVQRNSVAVIVRNPKNNSYLCIEWKSTFMHGVVTGGIEEGESIEDAARREVFEETGYKNLKLIEISDIAIHCLFFQRVKKENRWARFQYVFFDLENEEREEISEKESSVHTFLWKKREDLREFFSVTEGIFVVDILDRSDYFFTNDGILHNSGEFTGLSSEDARIKMVAWLEERKLGKRETVYKLRDWVFSRQRYWGEPIPLVYCESCAAVSAQKLENHVGHESKTSKGGTVLNTSPIPGWIPLSESDLPLKLPEVKSFVPTETGESPLAGIAEWAQVPCPVCGAPARRETDTMPNWAGSSWYFLRYADPRNQTALASRDALQYWMPVDWYNGGMEHTTLHLLYSRFWHKFLFDIGVVPTSEPYEKRTSHGLILAEGGVKMSKSKGNVVNPDDIVRRFGADTLRIYEMFMGPFDQAVAWSMESISGSRRFLEKVWKIGLKAKESEARKQGERITGTKTLDAGMNMKDRDGEEAAILSILHKTIQKVTDDIEAMRFNTAVSSLMILANEFERRETVNRIPFETFLLLLSPFAPHIAEELWAELGHAESLSFEPWPVPDKSLIRNETAELIVQINGKLRAKLRVDFGASQASVEALAREDAGLGRHLERKAVLKVIFVPNRLLNFVVKDIA